MEPARASSVHADASATDEREGLTLHQNARETPAFMPRHFIAATIDAPQLATAHHTLQCLVDRIAVSQASEIAGNPDTVGSSRSNDGGDL